MQTKKYEFTIIGSGAGGATLARELSKKGKQVLVVERGGHEKRGSFEDFLIGLDIPTSKEGVSVLRKIMAGGTTVRDFPRSRIQRSRKGDGYLPPRHNSHVRRL